MRRLIATVGRRRHLVAYTGGRAFEAQRLQTLLKQAYWGGVGRRIEGTDRGSFKSGHEFASIRSVRASPFARPTGMEVLERNRACAPRRCRKRHLLGRAGLHAGAADARGPGFGGASSRAQELCDRLRATGLRPALRLVSRRSLAGQSPRRCARPHPPAWLYGEGRVAQIEHTILHGIRAGDPKGWNLADMPGFARADPYKRYKVALRSSRRNPRRDRIHPGDRRQARRPRRRRPRLEDLRRQGPMLRLPFRRCAGRFRHRGPQPVDDVWLYGNGSREDIYDSVARGRGGICPAWIEQLEPGHGPRARGAGLCGLAQGDRARRRRVARMRPPEREGEGDECP